ncbi:MAG: hypothetical protein DMG54_10795 [Acidobacteria bacterium]|nr:MAG: hypothetical protein DMG54_10795 [Acidobacteriota bacterium]
MMEKNKIETGFSSDAKKEARRVVFVTKKTSAKVVGDPGPQLMTYPHLLIREAMAFQLLVIAMVLVALFWDAPLEQLANPLLTPNPAKAPWYFLGLQELLHLYREAGEKGLAAGASHQAALLVGNDVVHRCRYLFDRGGDFFPGPRLVVGVAVENSCRLKR